MAQKYLRGTLPSVHRIDLPCEQAGFSAPPFDVHVKFLPNLPPAQGWTLLAHASAGKPTALAPWLAGHAGITHVRVEPGLAPKLLRAAASELPPLWAAAASFAKVHHLDLAADGQAAWFVEGAREDILAFVQDLEEREDVPVAATQVRCRPVNEQRRPLLSRRQHEILASAVAMGYYDIPHRIDLRSLAAQTGLSLGSLSELLRRAEATILTHYVDAALLAWPAMGDEPGDPFRPVESLLEPVAAIGPGWGDEPEPERARPTGDAGAPAGWPFTRRQDP